jgi:hypothetical protein
MAVAGWSFPHGGGSSSPAWRCGGCSRWPGLDGATTLLPLSEADPTAPSSPVPLRGHGGSGGRRCKAEVRPWPACMEVWRMDVVETRLRCSEDLPLLPSRPAAGLRRGGRETTTRAWKCRHRWRCTRWVSSCPAPSAGGGGAAAGRWGQLGKASGASKDGGGRSCSGAHAQIRSVASRVAAAGWALLRGRCGDGTVVGALRGWRGGWAPVGSPVSRSTGEMKETGGYLFLP